jgi:hypothetical protein
LPDNPLFNNYRWLVTEPQLKRFAGNALFQAQVRDQYKVWQQDLAEFGPSLPVPPPRLPDPEEYFRSTSGNVD